MFGNRNKRYRETIAEGLSEAHSRAVTEDVALDDVKLIVFSDLHRGTGDRADDFRRCRRLYHGALGYYDSLDYRLFLLGDVEEIWERLLPSIVRKYEQTLELEQRFFERGRGVRFFGNHDEALQWQINYSQIEKYLAGEKLIESLRMRIFDEASDKDPLGEIYFAHGHQGQSYNAFHRFVVSWLWAPIQMVTGAKPQKLPSHDQRIRQKHEQALYEWAASQSDRNLLLIAGHTHNPVFMSTAWQETIRAQFEALKSDPETKPKTLAMAEAKLRWAEAAAAESRSALPDGGRPCYFNSGCCSYSDGTITGIEIAEKSIRLVRWNDFSGLPDREVLREAKLKKIFENCCDGEGDD